MLSNSKRKATTGSKVPPGVKSMRVLLFGRHRTMMNVAIKAVTDAGFNAVGVLNDEDAIASLRSGEFHAVTIGGGVEPLSRELVKNEARKSGAIPLDVFGPDDLLKKLKGISN